MAAVAGLVGMVAGGVQRAVVSLGRSWLPTRDSQMSFSDGAGAYEMYGNSV